MIAVNLSPKSALRGVDDVVELLDALERQRRGPGFSATFLRRFVYFVVRDRAKFLASERGSLTARMALLARCTLEQLLFDVERCAAELSDLDECEHLERITGMTGPADLGDEQ